MDYTAYLTQKVLDDHEIVTHRSLSRALNVHIDHAKRMLYAFYTSHSTSLSATYLIRGVRTRDQQSHTPVSVNTHLLVPSHHLDQAKSQFASIDTIFVYSVHAAPLPTLGVLGDVAVRSPGDPLVMGREWGVIRNGYVRRRKGMNGGVLPDAAAAGVGGVAAKVEAQKTGVKEEKGRAEEKKKGGIFDAFSKKPNAKPKREATATATAAETGTAGMKPKAATAQTRQKKQDVEEDDGDIELGGMDDDDEGVEPEEVFIRKDKNRQDEPGRVKTTSTSTMTERQAREEELRRMMEGESEGEEQGEKEEDEEMVDAEEPPAEQPVPRDPSPSPPPAPQKGKRLVTRKRTVKDAEGFLVTTEEKVWESVDEGEGEKQERPKQKKRTQSEGQSQDEKKSAGKKEKKQGSIMSFFAKRS